VLVVQVTKPLIPVARRANPGRRCTCEPTGWWSRPITHQICIDLPG